MKKSLLGLFGIALLIGFAAHLHARDRRKTLVITMTNDPDANALVVFDADTHARLQTLSTNGKGGVAGNARGIKEFDGKLLAAVNYKSGTVAVFKREDDRLSFEQLVFTTSPPVSIDFGNGHMYVAGDASVDSFEIYGNHIGRLDGSANLTLAGGGIVAPGAAAQIGVVDKHSLLVTIKTDPIPGTVDVIHLRDSAIFGAAEAVSAPDGTLTPFGFSVYPGGTAVITLAHSGHDGLFRDGAFKDVIVSGGQSGNCWTTRAGKYVFIVNTGSSTISRVLATGSHVFVDAASAATIATGGSPTDTDADGNVLGVIDHTSGPGAASHLTLFTYDRFGELTPDGSPIHLTSPSANGLAIMTEN